MILLFPIPKPLAKLLANALIALMLLNSPAGMAAVLAQSEDGVAQAGNKDGLSTLDLTVDKLQNQQVTDDTSTTSDDNTLTDKEKALNFANRLTSYYFRTGQKGGPEWLKTTDIQLNWTDDNKPIYSFETVQPLLGGITKQGQLWFWQGRYAHSSDIQNTANLGVGWRKLSPDKTSMIGFNAFYDYGFQYDLERLGVGAEYFNKLAEYRINWYQGLSSDREIDSSTSTFIRVVPGIDYEAGTSFAHLPWLTVYAGGYYWDNKYHDDEIGWKARTTMRLTPGIRLEAGYSHSNYVHEPYLQVTYNLASAKAAARAADLTSKMLQKVQRQNDIKTETYTKSATSTGTVTTVKAVEAASTSTPIAAALTMTLTDGTTTKSVTTDTTGTATFTSLPSGTYTVTLSDSWGNTVTGETKITVGSTATTSTVAFYMIPVYITDVYGTGTLTIDGNSVGYSNATTQTLIGYLESNRTINTLTVTNSKGTYDDGLGITLPATATFLGVIVSTSSFGWIIHY